MFRLTRSQVQPIGLDIGFEGIKMLQLEVVGGDSLSVVAAARQPFPDDVRRDPELRMACAVDLIRQTFRRNHFRGRGVVAALPREIVHSKNLRLPVIPASELAAAVRFEAKNIFPFDTDTAAVRHMAAGEVRQGADVRQEIIALATRDDDVNNYLEQLHRAGCVVESLDAEPCALYRGIERFIRRREDEQEVHVLVDVGSRASLVVVGRGRDVSFIKPIEIGGRHLHEAVSKKLGITLEEARALRQRLTETPEEGAGATGTPGAGRRDPVRQAVFDATRSIIEDLGREISLCLRYYSVTFRGQRPTKLRLLGGESGDAQLLSLLNTALTIPVEAGRPLYSVNISRMKLADRHGSMGEWAVALGLALKMTRGHFGARDGKPRDPNAPIPATPAPVAEVVDLNQLPEAPTPGASPAPVLAGVGAREQEREVARA
ncbi:MAG: pilus assembly protein PilM [Tepidisphaeraceae bacterium]